MQSRFIKDKDVESRDRKDNRGSGWASGRIFLYAGAVGPMPERQIRLLDAGAVVLLLASALMCNSKYQENQAHKQCNEILERLISLLPEQTKGFVQEGSTNQEGAYLEVKEISCIGILEIPLIEEAWPVQSEYEDGKYMPKCESGSAESGNLVIKDSLRGGLFRSISVLNEGMEVRFTDIWGEVYTYNIVSVSEKANRSSDGDLVLVTQNRYTGNEKRIYLDSV